MGRYLTPSRVGLLALLVVYTESVVSAEATIPILSFLASEVIPTSGASRDEAPTTRNTLAGSTTDTIEHLSNHCASGIPGRTVWDLFVNQIWKIESLDALHVFFEDLPSLLQGHRRPNHNNDASQDRPRKIQLSRSSPMGLFTRRAHLEFTRLQFNDTVLLWQDFLEYRNPTFQQWRKRNPSVKGLYSGNDGSGLAVTSRFPMNLKLIPAKFEHKKHCVSSSSDDIEKLLEFQVHQIQSMAHTFVRIPQE